MQQTGKFADVPFGREREWYRGVKHQAFVGTGYFDGVAKMISGGLLSTAALAGSTEEEQFDCEPAYQ
ncbi:MAG TPA: hypothetical protein VFD58_20125 [Blastocatellia bacterium]|nr:hypothetical protein [Blastocatellia bacterium]